MGRAEISPAALKCTLKRGTALNCTVLQSGLRRSCSSSAGLILNSEAWLTKLQPSQVGGNPTLLFAVAIETPVTSPVSRAVMHAGTTLSIRQNTCTHGHLRNNYLRAVDSNPSSRMFDWVSQPASDRLVVQTLTLEKTWRLLRLPPY